MRSVTALLFAMLLPTSAMAEQFDLACTWAYSNSDPSHDLILHIDTDRSRVNGRAAKVSEAEIRFEVEANDGSVLVTTINRYTGSLDMGFSGQPHARGKCVKPTQRQF